MNAPALDPKYTHWGEAAFLLSLDIADPALAILLEDADTRASLRDAARTAILENRQAAQQGKLFFLKEVMQWHFKDEAAWAIVTDFVDRRLGTLTLPQNTLRYNLSFLYDADANNTATDALPEGAHEPDFRTRVVAEVDADAFDQLFAAACQFDDAFMAGTLSDWDSEILSRNVESYGAVDPLRRLYYSLETHLLASAMKTVLHALQMEPPLKPIARS